MTLFRGLAAQIEEAIGREATLALLGRWGGCQIALPVKAEGSALAGVIGVDAAAALIRAFGHGKITLPCADARGMKRRRAQAIAMLRAGRSLQEVALACDLHTRTVSLYRADIEAEAGAAQMKLPL
jgi:DNA-binding NarL/FixJ family response regulator